MLLNKSWGSHLRCHLQNRIQLGNGSVSGAYAENFCVPKTITWVDSELWASLVDVLRTVAVALLFIGVRFTHHHKKNFLS